MTHEQRKGPKLDGPLPGGLDPDDAKQLVDEIAPTEAELAAQQARSEDPFLKARVRRPRTDTES